MSNHDFTNIFQQMELQTLWFCFISPNFELFELKPPLFAFLTHWKHISRSRPLSCLVSYVCRRGGSWGAAMGGGSSCGDSAGTCARLCCACSHRKRPHWCHRRKAMPAERSDSYLCDRGTGTLKSQRSDIAAVRERRERQSEGSRMRRGDESATRASTDSLTLTRVGLPAAAVGGPPGTIVVEWGTLLAVLPCCVVSTQTPARHLEDTSGAAQLLHTCCLDL